MRAALKRISPLSLPPALALCAAMAGPAMAEDVVHPAKMDRDDLAGKLFDHPDTLIEQRADGMVKDITSLKSSDGRFASGLYSAGPSRVEIKEPYGVDEFMYFLEGSVNLISADGTVQIVEAGEAVTIPKEWTGIWETDGYRKIWVIYSADGSGL